MCVYINIHIYIYIERYRDVGLTRDELWLLHDMRSLQSNLALFNHPCIAPSICIAHIIAILSHGYCAIYDPPPTTLLYAIHHTKLVLAISCKGQDEV